MIYIKLFLIACFSKCGYSGLSWDTLRVTFPFFSTLPLTQKLAIQAGFHQIGGGRCSGSFQGFRYMKDDVASAILLYDVKGNLAGLQTSFPETYLADKVKRWYKQHPMFVAEKLDLSYKAVANATNTKPNNSNLKPAKNAKKNTKAKPTKHATKTTKPKPTKNAAKSTKTTMEKMTQNATLHYTLTAYLVDPKIICSTGRSDADVKKNPSGSDLYLKNGTNNVLIPKERTGLSSTRWTEGRCVPGMGKHYYYDIKKNMNCDHFVPFFVMYNKGMLTGFGFAGLGIIFRPRFEYSLNALFLPYMMGDVPDCLRRAVTATALHVYLNVGFKYLLC